MPTLNEFAYNIRNIGRAGNSDTDGGMICYFGK